MIRLSDGHTGPPGGTVQECVALPLRQGSAASVVPPLDG